MCLKKGRELKRFVLRPLKMTNLIENGQDIFVLRGYTMRLMNYFTRSILSLFKTATRHNPPSSTAQNLRTIPMQNK